MKPTVQTHTSMDELLHRPQVSDALAATHRDSLHPMQ
jgi:hypothetical protein